MDDVRPEVRHSGHFLQNCCRHESARRLLDYRGRVITLQVTACQWQRDRKRLSSDMFHVNVRWDVSTLTSKFRERERAILKLTSLKRGRYRHKITITMLIRGWRGDASGNSKRSTSGCLYFHHYRNGIPLYSNSSACHQSVGRVYRVLSRIILYFPYDVRLHVRFLFRNVACS